MCTPTDDQENLSLVDRLRAAVPGDAVLLYPDEDTRLAGAAAEKIRQERIDELSKCLAENIANLLVKLIRNEMERKP